MERSNRTMLWIIGGGVVVILCLCLCALTVLAAVSFQRAADVIPDFDPGDLPPPPQPDPPVEFPDPDPPADEAVLMAERLRETDVPIADPIEITRRLLGIEDIPRMLAENPPPVEPGTVQTFWASDVDENTNFQVDAELVYATEHVYFWVDQSASYDFDDVKALVDTFEDEIYPTVRSFFGSEWTPGVDGDPHLYMLYAHGLGFSVAGYFSSVDSYSPLVHEYSNGHEMFYLSADNVGLNEAYTYGVLAHEFQHMVHWNLDPNEETWMNEGLSELATLLTGYDLGGFDSAFARRPDLTLTYWPSGPGGSGANYGQSFLFLAYFLERFGNEATQQLVADPENGLESIDETLRRIDAVDPQSGAPIRADDLFLDWAVTLLLNDPGAADGRYAYRTYRSAPPAGIGDRFRDCPVDAQTREVSQYGFDIIELTCPGDHLLRFEGAQSVKVVPADPHSGDYAFWSNRGDESNMTLTQTFDFRGVEAPIEFSYWVWYDIEEGWDYLYLEASADGGETWEILTTPSGTDEDPSGNSYGWAYNGYSGGGDTPRWIQETVDLSAYAGEQTTLRFEYITDAAVNGEGLLLDDLSIEAIDYEEGFESGDGGWEAAGFLRLYNQLPQTFRLALVEVGGETRVRTIELDEAGTAEIDVELGGAYEAAYLVVGGTTRGSWQPAPYRFAVPALER